LNPSDNYCHLVEIKSRIERAKVAHKYLLLSESTSDLGLNQLAFDAILFYLLNIGESVNHLNADFKAKHSNIPWRLIIGLRHRLAHDHNSIKVEIVHKVLDRPLQDLKELCNISLAFE
jgi:uncharacterized protein with HEPN domain